MAEARAVIERWRLDHSTPFISVRLAAASGNGDRER